MNFGYPQDLSVFIYTNSDVEAGSVDLKYGPNVLETVVTKWDNEDNDSDGVTEVRFEDFYFDAEDYANLTIQAYGTNVYDDYSYLTGISGFTWNSGQWENHDLESQANGFNYDLPAGENRTFHFGWNWASCPRLFRTGNDGFDAEIVIDDLEPYALIIEAEVPFENYMNWMPGWNPPGWHHNNDFDEFVSTSGYKIKLKDDYVSYDLDVYGTILPAGTEIYLQGNDHENWIDYYLEYSLRPSEAFAQIWDNVLYSVKGEDWSMWKIDGKWHGSNERYTIDYGEMVIAKCTGIDFMFEWDNESPPREKEDRDKAENFSYEEEADYIPILVELDPGDEPLEVGVMVEGECKGSAKVEGESVQINAYILEGEGEDVEFEMFYGRSKPEKTQKDYLVYNPNTNLKEKRVIRAGEYSDYYVVSFNEDEEDQTANHKLQVRHSPNPFHTSTAISYNLPEEKDISLEVYNIKGQRIKTLYNGNATIGEHQVTWNGTDENNKKVSSGIYFYKLITPEKTLSKKMLLMR